MEGQSKSTGELGARAVTGVLAATVAAAQMGASAVNVALPEIADWAGVGVQAAQWTVVSYVLAMTAASLVVGHVSDAIGRMQTLLLGLAVFLGGGAAAAVASQLGALIVARAIQGIGAAAMTVLPLAIARDTVASRRSGTVMGLLGTAAAVGTASGPAIGGFVVGMWEWRAVFWVMVPVPLAICLLVLVSARRASDGGVQRGFVTHAPLNASRRDSFDVAGCAAISFAVGVFALACVGAGLASGQRVALVGVVLLLVVLVGMIERRAAHPVLPPVVVRHPTVRLGAILNLIVSAIMMSTLVIGPFYLVGALEVGSATVGAVMAVGPVTSICIGVPAGRLVDRGEPRRLIVAGLLVMAVAAAALAILPPLVGLPGYLTGTMLLAPGYQLFMAANNVQVMSAAPAERRGAVSGVLGLARSLGLVTGSSFALGTFAAAVGVNDVAAAPADSLAVGLRTVFVASAVVLVVAASGAGVAARRQPARGRPMH